MNIPEGMTAEKLRTIADWLDTYDRLAQAVIERVEAQRPGASGLDLDGARVVAAGKEVQNDLRAWADALEATQLGDAGHLVQVGWLDYAENHDGPFDFDAYSDFHHVGWMFGAAFDAVPVYIKQEPTP